ncbi:hypothetical protein B0H15DRAFT_931164 [Mycena belliarum]|uniref:F-box domain-containing protein n=1 Tax=Mycena belliarum TaxID=1033014 RepID=A0AAD6U261_9AGAR|nr:hypothetical protein B0H15DRAFT_931164 [Mycena belliae]
MKKRAAKRQKFTAVPQADAGPLSAENSFVGMPLDVVLQFFLFMSPAELLAMYDVNKGFRRMLDSGKKASTIWARSREYHGIPKPFKGFTERTWAQFMFGTVCEGCKEDQAREPDFGLMMRLCADCRVANLCQDLEFSTDSDEDDTLGPVLVFEHCYPHSHWYRSREELFTKRSRCGNEHWWEPYLWDILPIVRAARRGEKAAEKKLAKLEEEGQRRLEYGAICDDWRDKVEAEDRRCKGQILTSKFKALGYQDFELAGLNDQRMLAQIHLPLTDNAWEGMRRTLEGSIKDKRRDRLLRDHPDTMNARMNLARGAYATYAATVVPIEAVYLPTVVGLDVIPAIRTICEREPDVVLTRTDFAHMPTIIGNWVDAKRARLTDLVNTVIPDKTGGWALASTIFRCGFEHENLGRPAMFGGDEAMRHVGDSCNPQLDIPLSKVASALIVSLGLDPEKTTAADMDGHAARFRCSGCVRGKSKQSKRNVELFTWRGCPARGLGVVDRRHSTASPSTLTPSMARHSPTLRIFS